MNLADCGLKADWGLPPPSKTITRALQRKKWTALEFSAAAHLDADRLLSVLNDAAPIWPELAASLEKHVGGSSSFWLNREQLYRESLRQDSRRELGAFLSEVLPLKEMKSFGWLKAFDCGDGDSAAAARFFDVSDTSHFVVRYGSLDESLSFRKSEAFELKLGPLAAWFRAAELEASGLMCQPWCKSAAVSAIPEIRALSQEKEPEEFIPRLRSICSSVGIAICVVRGPKGCPVSGATKFLSDEKAMIALSFRYLSDDQFWFSVLHELGHLILHEKERVFIESSGIPADQKEIEANKFAKDVLVPEEARLDFEKLAANKYDVVRFARKVGISPGLVVGQLQHAGKIRRNQLNFLKRRYKWAT